MHLKVLFILIHLSIPQLGYELSKSTVSEFRELTASIPKYQEYVQAIPSLKMLLVEVNGRNSGFSVNITNENWSRLADLVGTLQKKSHLKIAQVCNSNMSDADVSQTSSDRKFWHELYTVHSKLSR